MSKCKTCKATIIWMKTRGGKLIPVDWKEEIRGQDIFDSKTMIFHFNTCSNPKEFKEYNELA